MTAASAVTAIDLPISAATNATGTGVVNQSISVAGMDTWRREAIQKVIRLGSLHHNWDAQGSSAPARAVVQTAIDFLFTVPDGNFSAPRVNPVSGGGIHLEWSSASREIEIYIEPSGRVEPLKVQDGMPIEDEPISGIRALFHWLTANA